MEHSAQRTLEWLSTDGFMPHGHCYLWTPELLWTFVISEAVIVLAYFSIPFGLMYFVSKRPDLRFNWIFKLFSAFIFACGITHLFNIWTIWHADYWLSAFVTVLTAAISLTTAIMLWPVLPRALKQPSLQQLEQANAQLQAEIEQRKTAEAELFRLKQSSDERYKILFEQEVMGVAEVDTRSGTFLNANKKFCAILGYDPVEILSTNFHSLTHPDDLPAELLNMLALKDGRISDFTLEKRCFRKDGATIWLNLTVSPTWKHNAKQGTHIVIVQDITEQMQSRQQLLLSATVFEHAPEGMMITDADNHIVSINRTFAEITGYTHEEVVGKDPRILKSDKHDRDFYRTLWRTLHLQGSWQGELWNRRKNGEVFPEWVSISVIKDASGNVINHFAVYSDLLQKKAAEELDHLKHYDPLTDLPNRSLLEDRIESAIIHAQQHGRFIAVIFLNLDHFHTVNDMFGHMGGDRILITTAQRLVEAVPAHATVTRLSADTFVIALPDLNTSEEINRIAEIIVQKLYLPVGIDNHQVQLSVRMGISVYPMDGDDAAALMKCADAALFDAKQSGNTNSFRFYSASMNEHARKLVTMGGELRSAIEQHRLVLHYQPQVDIVSGEIVGVEALIRINHPTRGDIPPGEFIAVAEETGLIIPMGEWTIREACRQMQLWHSESHSELIVAVNLSPLQLHQSNLVETVQKALDDSGLPARYLELEFTESAIMQNVREAITIMKQFKAMGLHLSIDDFGTGYSSLSYLKQFPVDKLKIDQSFVSNITQDPNDAAIVQAIIALGRTLGMATIAEGVETEAQLGYLRSVHCKEMQGYLYSHPLPAADLAALLVRGKMLGDNKSEKVLLLVDDEENVVMSLKRILRREGYMILTASSAEEALEVMAQHPVNVVLSDQRMPGMSGVEFLRRVKTMHPDVVRMILSGYTEIGTLTDAINKGEIYQFITKPWENEALIGLIREAFVRYDLLKRNTK